MLDFGCRLTVPQYGYEDYQRAGAELFKEYLGKIQGTIDQATDLKPSIKDLVNSDNANEIMDLMFPRITADIFISHSHADEKTALGLMGFLKEKIGLTVFVDSVFWAYKDMIVAALAHPSRKECLDYQKTSTYVSFSDMMLTTSLTKMIEKTPLFILLQTSNTTKGSNATSYTYSPWIFHEINMFNTFVKLQPRKLLENRTHSHTFSQLTRPLKWEVELEKLCPADKEDMEEWADNIECCKQYPRRPSCKRKVLQAILEERYEF